MLRPVTSANFKQVDVQPDFLDPVNFLLLNFIFTDCHQVPLPKTISFTLKSPWERGLRAGHAGTNNGHILNCF
jgi:hypothetical protein